MQGRAPIEIESTSLESCLVVYNSVVDQLRRGIAIDGTSSLTGSVIGQQVVRQKPRRGIDEGGSATIVRKVVDDFVAVEVDIAVVLQIEPSTQIGIVGFDQVGGNHCCFGIGQADPATFALVSGGLIGADLTGTDADAATIKGNSCPIAAGGVVQDMALR